MGETLVSGLAFGGIYGLLAVGIVLVHKGSRVLNFAQGELGTFALFIAWVLIERRGMPWLVGAVAGIVVAAAIAFAFERIVVRRMASASKLSITVATIGLFLLLFGIELRLWGVSPQILHPPITGQGPTVFGVVVLPTQILALATVVGLGIGLGAFLRSTDFGLGVLAASQDPQAVRLLGVPLRRVSSFTWTAAGAIAGLAALLVQPTVGLFHAGMMTLFLVKGLAAALVGGLRSLPGAFVGGVVVGLLDAFVQKAFVQSTFPGMPIVAVMVLIIAVLLVRPQGLFGAAGR